MGLPSPLVDALKAHKAAQDAERELAADLWRDEGWIFAQPTGTAIDPRRDYQHWCDLLAEADVRPARLHDARHTAATILLVLKVPTPAVMRIMGWSNPSMASRYQHLADEVLSEIAGQVGGLLWADPTSDQDESRDGEGGTADGLPAVG